MTAGALERLNGIGFNDPDSFRGSAELVSLSPPPGEFSSYTDTSPKSIRTEVVFDRTVERLTAAATVMIALAALVILKGRLNRN